MALLFTLLTTSDISSCSASRETRIVTALVIFSCILTPERADSRTIMCFPGRKILHSGIHVHSLGAKTNTGHLSGRRLSAPYSALPPHYLATIAAAVRCDDLWRRGGVRRCRTSIRLMAERVDSCGESRRRLKGGTAG